MPAFATTPQGNTLKSTSMNVSARVIAPLTINATPMEFGDIIKGTEATAEGTYTITGENNQLFTFSITPITHLTNGSHTLTIELDGINDLPDRITNGDTLTHTLTGTLRPSETTVAGTYTGTITATIIYQ